MILVISIVAPSVASRYGRRIALAQERDAYEPGEAPQRVLLPFSRHSEHREALLDAAVLIREPGATEPVYAITVVRPGETDRTDAAVADAEATLEETAAYAAGAEVRVVAQTHIAYNVASGIATAAAENRASIIVIGWDGAASRTQSTFGSVIDRVLQLTDQQVVVARVREPLNTTERVRLVLPPNVDHNDGFYEAIHTVKIVASELDAELHAHVVEGDLDQYRTLLELVTPRVPLTVHDLGGWDGVDGLLAAARVADLVVVASARRGRIGWHPELQTLPKRVSTTVPGNFAVVYPPVETERDDRRFLKLR